MQHQLDVDGCCFASGIGNGERGCPGDAASLLIKAKPSGVAREFELSSIETEREIVGCVEGIAELLGWVDAQINVAEKARGQLDGDVRILSQVELNSGEA